MKLIGVEDLILGPNLKIQLQTNCQISFTLTSGNPALFYTSGTSLYCKAGSAGLFFLDTNANIVAGFDSNGRFGLGSTGVSFSYGFHQYGGQRRLQALATPVAPSLTNISGSGTSFWWWLVAEDRAGFQTRLSLSATIATGATPNVTVTWPAVLGAVKYYLLRTTTSTAPSGTANVLVGSTTTLTLTDTLATASLTAFTVPIRNNTADSFFDGNVAIGSLLNTTVLSVGCAYTSTASVTVNTATTATLVGAGVGSLTCPANSLLAGKTLRIQAWGYLTTTASPSALTFLIKLGTTTILTTGALTPTVSMTNRGWVLDAIITVRTIGTAGTVFGQGCLTTMQVAAPTATSGAATWFLTNTAATAIDTTVAQALDFQVTDAGTGSTIVCSHFILEVLN